MAPLAPLSPPPMMTVLTFQNFHNIYMPAWLFFIFIVLQQPLITYVMCLLSYAMLLLVNVATAKV